ncbi:hypothetical protein mRhiFer1_009174 [Rhinolophus ferrumequinum]|uniref:Uncharacterized protein n=1 Tax=Rhinolophus ferrumequinum TaxID=59479 RepID=A0A7J7SJ42_RHIFE|nr:hypothetical protein mRhiFer1_009174 [Rhinolophus ferrumequinum]
MIARVDLPLGMMGQTLHINLECTQRLPCCWLLTRPLICSTKSTAIIYVVSSQASEPGRFLEKVGHGRMGEGWNKSRRCDLGLPYGCWAGPGPSIQISHGLPRVMIAANVYWMLTACQVLCSELTSSSSLETS